MANNEKEPKEPGLNLSEEALTRIMTSAVRAGQQPTAEEQAEKDAEVARRKQRAKLMQRLVQTERRAKLKREEMCRHEKPDGEKTLGGQAFSDGIERFLCLRCQKIMIEQPTPAFEIAKAELSRLIEAGKVTVRPDGTIEIFENRLVPKRQRSMEEAELEA